MATATSEATASWSELLGSNDWKGLLDPLDLGLRRLILRCGDFCQATYDAFNNDENSKYAGSSRYGKKSFFDKVMLESASDYQVSCFLYATAKVGVAEAVFFHSLSRESWDRESNWIGYIATTTDAATRALGRREIYVVWRGTTRNYEWINVFGARPESAAQLLRGGDEDEDDDNVPKVMNGWLRIYVSTDENSSFTKLSARSQLQRKIKEIREVYKNDQLSITLTGHSLGACLAILSAFDLVENGITDIPVSAVVFGSPQVGDKAFRERVEQFPNLKILHVKNKIDLIPLYPSAILGYRDVGVELEIDNRKSPSLKDSSNPSDWHNLQGMLHVVAGWNGAEGEFELKVKRSLALVNKSSEYLKDEYLIPGSWWVEKNRGLVRDENGEWILAPPADEDQPVPEF
ncbi:alpha/beta-Hydrolases superfamily protein [Perilla frutescens var. hirtella]|uniref:Phospholipase A1 n=1 Tax=Perilla frutescens var. hirtella TaxID=608512 RepID=A0AAD4JGQ4_PERFH|nr:alpha/beta-Hydrolases superfamily protein [Perilla frutescens var. hirtella]